MQLESCWQKFQILKDVEDKNFKESFDFLFKDVMNEKIKLLEKIERQLIFFFFVF